MDVVTRIPCLHMCCHNGSFDLPRLPQARTMQSLLHVKAMLQTSSGRVSDMTSLADE